MAHPNKVLYNPYSGQELRFVQTARNTGGRLLELESVYLGRSKEPAPHYHPLQEEWFTVLEGTLTVRINGAVRQLQKGDTLHVPSRTIHSMWNASEGKTAVNWKVSPALNTERFLETAMGLAAEGKVNSKGMPPLLQVALMASHYNTVIRLTKPPFAVQKLVFGLLTPLAYLRGYRPTYARYHQ